MKRIAVAVATIVCLLLILPSMASADSGVRVEDKTGDGTWVVKTWEVDIYPGEAKTTRLTLYNSSSDSLKVSVDFSPDSLNGGNLTFELNRSRFHLHGKSRARIYLTATASESATPGIYITDLEIKSEVPAVSPNWFIPGAIVAAGLIILFLVWRRVWLIHRKERR